VNRRRLVTVGKTALLLVVAIALQTLLISRISVLGISADLFLIFTVIVAISRGSMDGAIFGFCAGVVADIAYFQPLGLRSLIYVLTGYFVGMFVARFPARSPWSVFLLTGGSSLGAQFLFGLFQYVTGPRAGFLTMVGTQMLPEAVIDALVAVPVYLLLARLRVIPAAHVEMAASGSETE
jgi:rod shape-determining protein MreD